MFNNPIAHSRITPTLDFGDEAEDDDAEEVEAEDSVHMESETTQPVQREADRSVKEWLDAFAAHECDRAVFLRGVADPLAANRDSGWELLSLIDQYYRRKKISVEDFHALNEQLRVMLLGNPPEPTVAPVAPAAPVAAVAPVMAAAAAPSAAAAAPMAAVTRLSPVPTAPKPAAPEPQADVAPPPPPPPRAIVIGDVLRSRYRIQGILGRGGMGTVYAALDQFRINDADGSQRVAIKVLNTDTVQRPQRLEELRGEFQRLQTLSHPNIVRVHDFDRDGELTFFTMEHLSGAPLSRVLGMRNSTPLHRAHAFAIIRQVGAAIAYAHSRGVVHGDLNPRNIFVTDDGEIRILDFGASHRLRADPEISELDDPARMAVATPSYASCETLVGRLADQQDDIYSLACISYVLLQGKHPFQGRNALIARTKRLTPKRPPGLSAAQWRALKAGLQLDRKRRPDNMQAWLNDLNLPLKPAALPPLAVLTNGQPPREGRVPWVTGGLIALAAAAVWLAQDNYRLIDRAGAALGFGTTEMRNPLSRETALKPAGGAPGKADRSTAQPETPPVAPAEPKAAPSPAPDAATPQVTAAHATPATRPAHERATPASAPGLARIELAADTLEVSPLQPVASVIVHRRRNYRDNVSFTWWTESGTAKPGQDFVPVKARVDFIPAGENETHLLIPIVADPRRHLSKSFYVVVGDPSGDAALGSRTITMVTIPAAD